MSAMFDNSFWQPVALAARLQPGGILPIRLDGRDLVLWRAAGGEIAIWEDRCPHRGMKLSFGAVRESSLLCPYHGWTFGTDGQCRHVPAHPEIRPSRAMRPVAYAAAEAHGLIWANPARDAGDLPPLHALEGLELTPIRTMHIAAPAETVTAGLELATFLPGTKLAKGKFPAAARTVEIAVVLQVCDAASCALHIAAIGPVTPDDAMRISMAFTIFRETLSESSAA